MASGGLCHFLTGSFVKKGLTEALRTPSISAEWIYVYKHVYIYFLADGQAWAVESLESGNLMVYWPLQRNYQPPSPKGEGAEVSKMAIRVWAGAHRMDSQINPHWNEALIPRAWGERAR